MKVKVKLYMVYHTGSLDQTEALLGQLKGETRPLIFNAEVHEVEEA